jgi:hypothetical protein
VLTHWRDSILALLTAAPVAAIDDIMMTTAEDVVRRIAAECAYVDAQGGVGIRLKPAAAIVRAYGEQFRLARPAAPSRRSTRQAPKSPKLL